MPIFKLARKHPMADADAKPRLVKADNAKGVRAHLLNEFDITEADAEEAHALGEQGVRIETAAE